MTFRRRLVLLSAGAVAVAVVLASVVVYFVIKDQKPRTATDLCQMTWIPFVVWAILVGLYFVFMGTMIFSGIMGSAGTY